MGVGECDLGAAPSPSALDNVFQRLVGRQATEEERARLYRVRDALGLRDNDAFWSIVMALEYYDAFFRDYPRQLGEVTGHAIENARLAFSAAAEKEAAKVERMLAEQVAASSVQIARKLVERPFAWHRVSVALACVVAFGALCVNAGYGLASKDRPFWAAGGSSLSIAQRTLGMVLSVPAGWMMFGLALPAAAYGMRVGWSAGADAMADPKQKALGWCVVVVCVVGCAVCAVVLAKVT
jgi:hypothetical protein